MQSVLQMANKILHPHEARQEAALKKLFEYRELSSLALETGNEMIYSCFQKELNQILMEYLSWCFLDGIGWLVPHVVAMWLLNLLEPSIKLPFALPYVGTQLPVIVWYPTMAILFYTGRWLVGKINNKVSVDAQGMLENS